MCMDITIRTAEVGDYDTLNALYAEGVDAHAEALPDVFRRPDDSALSRDAFQTMLLDPANVLFVALCDRGVVGTLHVVEHTAPKHPLLCPRRYAFVSDVIVAARHRRRGVARALMVRAHDWARERGIAEVELNVWAFNRAALRLYEGLGYSPARHTFRKRLDEGAR